MAVRLGVVGCGAVHSVHAGAIRRIEGAELAGFYDVVPERSLAASASFDAPAFVSLDALLDASDAVCVCVPSGLHAEVGIAAARAGCHVLVEKPIDVVAENARSLISACAEARVKLSSVSQHRFARAINTLRDAVASGTLGKMIEGDGYVKWHRTQAYYDSGDWRGTWALDGGGCLINQGIHTIDVLQWIMGGVRAVQAITRTATHDIEVEDVAAAIVEFRSGAIGVIQGATCLYPGFAERVEVHGTAGSVIVEGDRIKLWQADEREATAGLYGGGVMQQPTPSVHLAGRPTDDVEDTTALWGEQHRLQIADFVGAIRDDRTPFITGGMGLEPLQVILAIYRSAAEGGRRVEVV